MLHEWLQDMASIFFSFFFLFRMTKPYILKIDFTLKFIFKVKWSWIYSDIWNAFYFHQPGEVQVLLITLYFQIDVGSVALKQTLDLFHCHTKRRPGWYQPSQAFFWYDTDYRKGLCCRPRFYFTVSVIPWLALAHDNYKVLNSYKACFCVKQFRYILAIFCMTDF